MNKKLITISVLVLIIAGFVGYKAFLSADDTEFETTEVARGEIVQVVSGTGSLVPKDKIQIEPETQARVKGVFVEVGDEVEAGELLIQLKNTQPLLALKEAKAKLETTKKKIDAAETKMKNAEWTLEKQEKTSQDSIKSARSELKSASTTLASKQQNLADIKEEVKIELKSAFEDARDTIDAKEIVAENALLKLDQFENSYFNGGDQIALKVRDKADRFESELEETRSVIATAERTESREDTTQALKSLKFALKEARKALIYVRDEAFDDPRYDYQVSSSDKTTAENYKTNVQEGVTALNSAQQKIDSTEASYRKNVNSAQAAVDTARAELESAQSNLKQVESQSDQKTTEAQANLSQAKDQLEIEESNLNTLQAQLQQAQEKVSNTKITAPMAGVITNISLEQGETAQSGEVALNLMPEEGYVIEADISEVDIGAVDKGDKVEVDFDAYPNEEYEGQVVKIYPAEIAKEGVIYYRIEVQLDEYPEKLKPGLTANLDIISAKKDNTLLVPYVALRSEDGTDYVEVLNEEGEVEKREVTLGIEGEMMVEIKKGLKEGEEVITSRD